MLSPGDGIALASIGGVIIAAIIKLVKNDKQGKSFWNFVTKEACDAHVEMFLQQLKIYSAQLQGIQKQLDDINKFLRNGYKK